MQQEKQDKKVVAIMQNRGDLGAVQRGQLISRLREQLRDAFMQRIRIMLENVDDAFFALADKAESNLQQAVYFEAMREVRLKRTNLEGDFVAGVLTSFERSLAPNIKHNSKAGSARQADVELSLVETDELEERLATEGMIGKAKRLYSEDIYLIGQRLAALSGQAVSATDENIAIGPHTVCEAFGEAAAILEMPIQPRLVLYKLFDRYVVGELGDIYAGFNLILREAGVLPNLRIEDRQAGSGAHKTRQGRRGRNAPADGRPGASQAEEVYEKDEDDELSVALRAFLGSVRNQEGGTFGGYGVMGAPVVSDRDLVMALTQLQQTSASAATVPVAANMLKAELRQTVTDDGARQQAFTPMDENTIDIVAMLFDFIFEDPSLPKPFKGLIARLQIPVLKVALIDRTFLTRKHHPARRLLNLMARAGMGWVPEAGQSADDLFVRIESLVNRVVDEFEDDIRIFEKVLEDFESQLDSEEHAAQERESAAAEQASRRENREIGKVVATAAIEQVMAGNRIPALVEDFFRGPWRDLMSGIYAASGSDSPAWMKALNIASTLVWSLMPKETEEARAQLVDTLPSMLRALSDGMEKLHLPGERREALFECLAREHSRLARTARAARLGEPADTADSSPLHAGGGAAESFSAGSSAGQAGGSDGADAFFSTRTEESSAQTREDAGAELDQKSFMARKTDEIKRMIAEGRFRGAEPVIPDLGDDGDEVILDEFLDCAESMEEGTWLDWTDAEGCARRIKLSWRSVISGKFFFVNRQGIKVVEMTPYALAAELRETRARIIEDAPVVDRALLSALDSLTQRED